MLGIRRQQGREMGEMECWETRADRLPVRGWGEMTILGAIVSVFSSILLRPLSFNHPPSPAPRNPLRLLLLTKIGLSGTTLDLHTFGPSLNEEMADQLF